jgi:probable phosphoglycerate mutase
MLGRMLELYLLRHGQTDFSREDRYSGSIDPPLTDIGRRMAEAFGAAYADREWTAIYLSPTVRTHATAAPLAERTGLTPREDEGLREISYGVFDGMTRDEAKARFPDEFAYYAADTAGRAPPGGETAFQVAARAALSIERIKREVPSGRVLLVSHKATIRIVVCALIGLDVRLFRERIAQPVAAVTRVELGPKGALLTRLGDDAHLPPELRHLEGT